MRMHSQRTSKSWQPPHLHGSLRRHIQGRPGKPKAESIFGGNFAIDASVHRYPWHNGKLSFADPPGERIWGGIGLSFVLLLPIALLLSLLDNGIATVVLLLSTNRRGIGAFIVVLLSILIVWNARRKLYTPLNGIMFALEGFHALCLAWDFVTRTYPDVDVDERRVRIKRKIDAAIASLEKQRSDLMRAGRWERLTMLHWGTAAVHAYDAQYWWLGFGIEVFELNAARETRNSRRRRPLAPPPSVTAPPPRLAHGR
ncbi:hypothetical protein B0H11DRAFT_2072639 [Mycena galericulata]|nr:hypothetical protein B0H11DRAFT_2072639 [Mycena galericulata]